MSRPRPFSIATFHFSTSVVGGQQQTIRTQFINVDPDPNSANSMSPSKPPQPGAPRTPSVNRASKDSLHPRPNIPKINRPSIPPCLALIIASITLKSGVPGRMITNIIPLKKFELAMECGGSFLAHCSIDKSREDGRELLMAILEPLVGDGVGYQAFLVGVNHYIHSRRYRQGEGPKGENAIKFLEEVTKGWKKIIQGRTTEMVKRDGIP